MHESLIRDRRKTLPSSNDPYVSVKEQKDSFFFFLRIILELAILFISDNGEWLQYSCQLTSLPKEAVE